MFKCQLLTTKKGVTFGKSSRSGFFFVTPSILCLSLFSRSVSHPILCLSSSSSFCPFCPHCMCTICFGSTRLRPQLGSTRLRPPTRRPACRAKLTVYTCSTAPKTLGLGQPLNLLNLCHSPYLSGNANVKLTLLRVQKHEPVSEFILVHGSWNRPLNSPCRP